MASHEWLGNRDAFCCCRAEAPPNPAAEGPDPEGAEAAGVPSDGRKKFRHQGPDIVAHSHEGSWEFECKGIGIATPQTHRNNFDRAAASVLSYFDSRQTRLGLALANDYLWAYNFADRLPRPLREATNLWVFLLERGTVYPYEPTEDLPYPGVSI